MKITLMDATILVTGAAGFIGFYLTKKLIEKNPYAKIIGIDNMSNYYDVSLKKYRLKILKNAGNNFTFIKGDITNKKFLHKVFNKYNPSVVVNLAAQAGVRYSIDDPDSYIESNIIGFYNILEEVRKTMLTVKPVHHLVYASSSSVYGENKENSIMNSIDDKTDSPVSLYAATKKSNELLAYAYSKLYKIPITGLRFFTVYGPMGRPDMAYFKFTKDIINGDPIHLYNGGNLYRDFTYVDDIVKGIIKVMETPIREDGEYCKIYNIGSGKSTNITEFLKILESCLIRVGITNNRAIMYSLPMQPGDVYKTCADISDLERDFDFKPVTNINQGLLSFALWYKSYYK